MKNQNMPMIDFLSFLFKKYKVLNKLSEKETHTFQNEIVMLLTDSNGNVDNSALSVIETDIGLPMFVLELLSNVLQRNPYQNQFEMGISISNISKELEHKCQQLNKKSNVLNRRQQKIIQYQKDLMNKIKDQIKNIQNQFQKKLLIKQTQIKKRIQCLLNQLKSKEKYFLEKNCLLKNKQEKLMIIQEKQCKLNQRTKLIQKKQKQIKENIHEDVLNQKNSLIKRLSLQIQNLQEQLKFMKTKIKNSQLAYKKWKSVAEKCMQNLKDKQQIISLDNLNFSKIKINKNQSFCQDLLLEKNIFQEQSFKMIFPIQKQEIKDFKIKYLQNENDNDNEKKIIQEIQSLKTNTQEQKIKCLLLIKVFIEKCVQFNHNKKLSQKIIELMLSLLEQSSVYNQIMKKFSTQYYLKFLEQVYLKHETYFDITEPTVLILSRIKLANPGLKISNELLKALQIRNKIEPTTSFLSLNINSLIKRK